MEQWEKEYLELISTRKEKQSEYTKEQKAYITEFWEEINRPDGTKWYVPNNKAIQKRKKKQLRHYRMVAF